MNNKYSSHLLISSILLAIVSILFYVFTIMPLVNILIGNANAGHIIVVITAPISTIIFLLSLCYFIVSLEKFLTNRNQKK